MRTRWPLALLLLAAGGCNCGSPPPATPIKLVATNSLGFDIFVPDDQQQGGLAVGHGDAVSFAPIAEAAACACQNCDQACSFDVCDCQPAGMAHRIHPGGTFSRTFAGNEHA